MLLLFAGIFCKRDFYRLLRIPQNASSQEIKRAHRKLRLKYHPDRAVDDE